VGKDQKLGVFYRKDRKLTRPPPFDCQFLVIEIPFENANGFLVAWTLKDNHQPLS